MIKNQVFNLKGVEIYTISNFLSQDECKTLCKLIDENNIRSSVAGKGKDKVEYVSTRTSSSSHLNQEDPKVAELDQRISSLLGLPSENGEPMQGQLYHESEFYDDHYDFFIGDGYTNHCLASGQRTWTVMIYLNNVPKGGNTEFPELGKIFQPIEGTAVVWKNSEGTGKEDYGTLHSGRPVIEGKKYIITKWFREHAYRPTEDQQLSEAQHKKENVNPISDKNGNPVPIEWIGGIPHARFKSYQDIPAITKEGFAKRKIPVSLFEKIKSYYNERRKAAIPEFDPEKENHLGEFIQSQDVRFPTQMIQLSDDMKTIIFDELQEELRKWSGRELHRTHCYGIRTYHRGAVLKKHTDGFETRIISAILNVDQEVDEPWALQIDDHSGKEHEVFLQPGEMCLYESAILRHGRVKPFKGNYFANLFVHYVNLT